MIGTNSPISFCEISLLFRICVDRSLWDSDGPMTAPTNSFCRSGVAENWASELFWACCCSVSLSSSRSRTG
jgi:hypothetical protein